MGEISPPPPNHCVTSKFYLRIAIASELMDGFTDHLPDAHIPDAHLLDAHKPDAHLLDDHMPDRFNGPDAAECFSLTSELTRRSRTLLHMIFGRG